MVLHLPLAACIRSQVHKNGWRVSSTSTQHPGPLLMRKFCCKLGQAFPVFQGACNCLVLIKLKGNCHSLLSMQLTLP
jgi:hypothetical protein